jgi:hypothetical protein
MDPAEWFSLELNRLESEWQAGRFGALVEAAALCGWNRLPHPEWLVAANLEQLERTLNGEPSVESGRGRPTTPEIHEIRWRAARRWLSSPWRETLPAFGHPATRAGAFAKTSEDLARTAAQGSAASIEASFKMVERQQRRPG